MWGLDPETWKQLENIREMVKLSHQTPTKEWPLVFVEEFGTLLVIREWPGGNITAYTAAKDSGARFEEGETAA
jgi:hypothetical protein